ncbi:MAG: hypothetical protein IT285_00385, partial [Bdellovibrionales bacterium]|nr:hypothetical protein [Bdellovibrionales bacterium]
SFDNNKTSGGFPVLKDIPILGTLFGGDSERTQRTELFIFLSPRILNASEAGLSG